MRVKALYSIAWMSITWATSFLFATVPYLLTYFYIKVNA
jgi:hypothetical protein